jgi:AraC-like DNA-binding protein
MTERFSNHPIRIEDKRRFQDFRVETALLKSDLSTYERMVYVVLCSYASREGECFPSLETVASGSGCSVRQVQRALRVLEEKGVLRCLAQYRPQDKRQTANVYSILGFPNGQPGDTGKRKESQVITAPSGGRVTIGHPPGDCQSPQEVEPGEVQEKEELPDTLYPAAGAAERGEQSLFPGEKGQAPQEKPEVTRESVPSAFRETYDLFLLKTGRTGITESELARIEALEKLHTPSRVQAEISKSLERFKNPRRPGFHPRDPSELTWHYLWDVLKNQKSGKARQEEQQPAGGRRNDPKWLKQLETWANGG